MPTLFGKMAVVTGASRGIGKAIALRLGSEGAFVVVHYRSSHREADEVVGQIRASGGDALAVSADFSQHSGVKDFYARLDAALAAANRPARFDILVNNAGNGPRVPFEAVTEALFDDTLMVDLRAPFFLMQGASSRLNEGGRIVNISSMTTRVAYPELTAYVAAKAALEALTLPLAAHLGARGITVNAVLPGATATDLNAAASDPKLSQAIAQSVALKRVGQPSDIADVVFFLVSDLGRWVTGQKIEASGGQRI